ncbi:hypothetical protein ENSA5_59890 [Enhygromyxa salina]|uniref:Cytochrome c domain-containing protein n=1 Tax=Enhygromyxa salina TaxID=215803 RepID=A0A2S9XDH4_9BACT|nr:hypothetical protein [Enhygromyxa salina]PRP90914.1 hypothetical protein ENSA5_59890 [Enhygromyxa salina]
MYTRKTSALLGLSLLAFGCGLEPVGEDGGDGEDIPPAVQQAFDESCATSAGCHAVGSSLVVLEAPESGQILTSTSSSGGGPFVTLGDLEASYIAQKILGGPTVAGATMPPSPQSDNDDLNQAIIIGWIAGVPIEDGGTGDGDGDGDSDAGDGDTGDGDGDPAPTCYIEAPIPAMPSFETDIWPIVENRCGVAGCHADLSGPLMPDAITTYDNLVDIPAGAAALDFVEPMSPDSSYLWHKLTGTQATVMGGSGSTMPFGSSMCSIELQAVYAWITTGAEL